MADISQTTFWNAFLNDDVWILIQIALQLVQQISMCSDNGLAPKRLQTIMWTNDGLVYWRI